VRAWLGRPTSAHQAPVDRPSGRRNGDGQPRRLRLPAGPMTVRRSRVRGLTPRFGRRGLPLLKRRPRAGGDRLPRRYWYGLAWGD
jgi:hypothetical protein